MFPIQIIGILNECSEVIFFLILINNCKKNETGKNNKDIKLIFLTALNLIKGSENAV